MALNSVTNALCFPYAVGAEPGQIIVPVLDAHKVTNFGGLPWVRRPPVNRCMSSPWTA
jgi:hypothetical protein